MSSVTTDDKKNSFVSDFSLCPSGEDEFMAAKGEIGRVVKCRVTLKNKSKADTKSVNSSTVAAMKTRVVALKRRGGVVVQGCDIYIGRACNMGGWRLTQSKWYNPFTIKQCGSAEKAVSRFEAYLRANPKLVESLSELKGKVLGCWCKKPSSPNAVCHGDVLARLADATG